MASQAYTGYFENGMFYSEGKRIRIPERRQIVLTIPEFTHEFAFEASSQHKHELLDAIHAIQEDSVTNGTDEMTLDEINEIIAECRREARAAK